MTRFAGFIRRRGRAEKLLLTVLTVGVVGSLAAFGVFSAFSSTTSNTNNSFTAGTVAIGGASTSVGSALYSVSAGKPGTTTSKCVKVSYTGTLPSNVKFYRSAFTGGNAAGGTYVNVSVTKGTGNPGTTGDCTDFAAAGTNPVFNSNIGSLGTDFTGGTSATKTDDGATWSNGDSVTYKIEASVADDNNAQGASTGTHSLFWEAHNT
jgi:hypothetical protein